MSRGGNERNIDTKSQPKVSNQSDILYLLDVSPPLQVPGVACNMSLPQPLKAEVSNHSVSGSTSWAAAAGWRELQRTNKLR